MLLISKGEENGVAVCHLTAPIPTDSGSHEERAKNTQSILYETHYLNSKLGTYLVETELACLSRPDYSVIMIYRYLRARRETLGTNPSCRRRAH